MGIKGKFSSANLGLLAVSNVQSQVLSFPRHTGEGRCLPDPWYNVRRDAGLRRHDEPGLGAVLSRAFAAWRRGIRVEKGGWVYILTNKPSGVLYTGVTSDLARRMFEHQGGLTKGFTHKYNAHRLVWYERYGDITEAIAREKAIKNWKRDWKVRHIEDMNPDWRDLWEELNA